MDLETRRRLLMLSARYGIPVVEDDFDSDLRFDGEPLPPLKALDEHDAVVHIGTFSKGLFPGLRLGWIAAPRPVVEAMGRSKLICDYHTSLLLQAAVLEFCRRGHHDRHLEKLVAIYRAKSRRLLAALERSLPKSVRWTLPRGGYAFWVTLPSGLSSEELLRQSADEGVLFTPGTHFFARGDGRGHLRLSISRVPLERIDEGIARLGRVLERLEGAARGGTKRVEDHEAALHI
jgi:GntR family transcriptional regulator/MocR family aminotransferase